MQTEDEITRLIDIEQIKALKARYVWALDNKRWDAMAETFATDGVFEVRGLVAVGRQNIVALIRGNVEAAVTVHIAYTPDISVNRPAATGRWGFFDYVEHPTSQGHRGYGYYEDTYVLEDSAWVMSRCTVSRIRIDPLPAGEPEWVRNLPRAPEPSQPGAATKNGEL
jgi:uncharacterized protein (TIGR02246 family)